jgi:hypothetical protein
MKKVGGLVNDDHISTVIDIAGGLFVISKVNY